jgi:8-oxo-dGTP diphosphatase
VLAAGGVVWRPAADGGVEVLLVHRDRYGDWTFPKGKLEPADPDEERCALREVEEEAGYRCRTGVELSPVHYRDRRGRLKRVRYWVMEPLSGSFRPNREVDRVAWLSPGSAATLLTYAHDRDVLAEVVRALLSP